MLLVKHILTRNLHVHYSISYVISNNNNNNNTGTATGTTQPPNDTSEDSRTDAARRVSAATRKVKQGHVRKAVDALIQPGMLEVTIETLEQLQKLHPSASDPLSPDDIEFAAKQAKQWLSSNDIAKRSERFYDNGSAPGPSGWTGAMLRPLLQSDICRRGLALIFSLLMNGDIRDPATRETLRAARLIPVPKGAAALVYVLSQLENCLLVSVVSLLCLV